MELIASSHSTREMLEYRSLGSILKLIKNGRKLMMFRWIILGGVLLTGCSYQQAMNEHFDTVDRTDQRVEAIKSSLTALEESTERDHREHEQTVALLVDIQNRVEQLENQVNSITPIIVEPTPPAEVQEISAPSDDRILLGARERILFDISDVAYVARVDTGAEVSSLHADDIQLFERDGDTWVRFSVNHESLNESSARVFEAPLKRTARIRQANAEEAQDRYVVELWARLGRIYQKTEFTLTDRNSLDNTVLIGRDFFMDIALVDVSHEFLESNN